MHMKLQVFMYSGYDFCHPYKQTHKLLLSFYRLVPYDYSSASEPS